MPWNYTRKTYAIVGETVRMELAYSEAAMHLQVAGHVRNVRIVAPGQAQILTDDGQDYSFPILMGEAGFYQESDGRWYYYPPMAEVE